ncbi:MAG: M3 family oligoendopeptidase [Acidobacteriota bacterium]|nr:M3 family oligoendopeptidase [Acidobacteriota bacterium]
MTIAPSTSESYGLGAWDLKELLEDTTDARVSEALESLEKKVGHLEAQRERLEDLETGELVEIVRNYESVVEEMAVLGAYAGLWFSADTQDVAALAFRNRVQHELTLLQNRALFFPLWWKQLPDARAEALMPGGDDARDTRFFLSDLRRLGRYSLAEETEQLINTKDADGIGGLMTVHSMLTNRLTFHLEVDGEGHELSRDELMNYALSPDGDLREAAYVELGSVLERESNILAQVYVHRVRDWHNENVRLRGYDSPIGVRNVANDIPNGAVEALLGTAESNVGVFHRYFRLKASWLGTPKLRRYDLYAPLTTSDCRVEYRDAVDSVLDTFAGFDPTFAAAARRVFDEGHIDSELRQGKRMGAFCASVLPQLTPWVLVNYAGRVRDVATLAHELGHAVHGMLSEDHSVLTHHPSLPLAETASVFAEMLMTDRLLDNESDPSVRREILATAVDDIYATVLRQAFFVRFEETAHAAVADSRSAEDLCDLYMQNLELQFGDAVEIADAFRYEWLGIPHIYAMPFYCYAYSFGQLLVLALFRRYQQDPEGFRPGYMRMLAYGGAARPEEILAEADIDPADPVFWQGGFDVISDLIDQLEAL